MKVKIAAKSKAPWVKADDAADGAENIFALPRWTMEQEH